MARRYSNINQGKELKLAQDNLETYRKTRTTKKTAANPTVGASRPKEDVAVKPFDSKTPDLILVGVVKASLVKLEPKLPGRVKKDAPALAAGTKIRGFRPARIHYFEPSSNTRTYVKSKLTGLNYLKYPGESYSSPFGALADNEEEASAAALVKTAVIQIAPSKDYRRAWYQSEQFRV